ncbi:MAG: DUF4199 domain-containing protein [Alistipes sp.]|nr:DUF4199 domain-containing protein [Alistipes sp.]
MKIKEFWMDVLRAAAIIGVVMALSHIFEQYMLLFSGVSLINASLVILIEGVIAAAVFVWLMIRFTRRISLAWNDRIEVGNGIVVDMPFTYGRAVSYGLLISMFAGIFVGVANTIFVDVMGYDLYRAAQIGYFEQIEEIMNAYNALLGSSENLSSDIMTKQIEMLETMDKPSIFATIISHMTSYMLYGGIASLVVAAVARRKRAQNISNE